MTTMVLAAEERTTLGKKVARLRRTGLIPATVYGKQVGPISIQIDAKAFDDIYRKHGRAVTIELQVAGHEPLTTTIHAVQRYPVSRAILHLDFLAGA
jgi:large subunit ribosomal protein L25